ncbi:hypothetical protein BT69DRAFT_1338186 [Atractiella rhizophila]|nr:hypothetical protein BT69DRAFT_1338186 [Atractiella rhizophila]
MSQPPLKKKKKPNVNGVVYSQPADTGSGNLVQTRLVYAIQHLKDQNGPIRLQDLAIRSGVDDLLTNKDLFEAFRNHEKVIYDDRTELWRYKPDHHLPTANALLHVLRTTNSQGGQSVKVLKDSNKEVGPMIESLEKQGKVIVIRNPNNGQMKNVFLDEVADKLQQGLLDLKVDKVDEEFKEVYRSLPLPATVDLAAELAAEGIVSVRPLDGGRKKSGGAKKKGGKDKRYNRRVRITNTHLKNVEGIDLSKDFVPEPQK